MRRSRQAVAGGPHQCPQSRYLLPSMLIEYHHLDFDVRIIAFVDHLLLTTVSVVAPIRFRSTNHGWRCSDLELRCVRREFHHLLSMTCHRKNERAVPVLRLWTGTQYQYWQKGRCFVGYDVEDERNCTPHRRGIEARPAEKRRTKVRPTDYSNSRGRRYEPAVSARLGMGFGLTTHTQQGACSTM